MFTVFNISIIIGAAAILYCVLKISQMVKRMTPDKVGVTILEKCQITGNKTLPSPIQYPLSALELVNSVIPVMVFFHETLDTKTLKESLADCLDDIPLFQARVRLDSQQDSVVLEANNQPVELKIQSLAGHNVKDFKRNNPYIRSRSTYQVPIFIDRLKLEKIFQGDEPLLRLVITQFETGGTAIGLSLSHLIFDYGTVYCLLHAWAERYKTRLAIQNGSAPAPNQFFASADRTQFLQTCGATGTLPSKQELEERLKVPLENGSLRLLTKADMLSVTWKFMHRFFATDDRHLTIKYTAEDLAILKRAGSCACNAGEWISGNDGLAAHVWHLITQLQAEDPADKRKKMDPLRNFCMVINARPRLDPPLPPDFLGNIVMSVTTQETREALLKHPDAQRLSQLALKLRQSMQQVTPDYTQALLQWMQLNGPEPIEKMPMVKRGYFSFVPCHESYFMLTNCASKALNFYNIGFGTASIKWIHAQSLYGCAMIIASADDPDALELNLSLPPSISIERATTIKNEMLAKYKETLAAQE